MKKIVKKWWFWALVAFFAIGISNGIRVTLSGGPDEEVAAPIIISSTPATSNTTDDKESIQKDVDALVDPQYKGNGYLCDILTKSDGSGYIVSLQINVTVAPPDSTEIIKSLEASIKGLKNEKIVEVQIDAVKDGKIIDHN